jgi:hypothetical protein
MAVKKAIVGAALAVLTASKAFGVGFIVPPDIDDIRQSTYYGTTMVELTQSDIDRTETQRVNINGANVSIHPACTTLNTIKCKVGSVKIYLVPASFQAIEKDNTGNYVSTSPSTMRVYATVPSGGQFKVCGFMGTPKGNVLLSDHNDNDGTTEDPNNPSWLYIFVKQVCQP